MPRFSYMLASLLGCLTALGADPEDSPIMDLSDVIGIEIRRSTLADRAQEESRSGALVTDAAQPSGFRLVRRFDESYVEYQSIQNRALKGGWVELMTARPRGEKAPPAVFLLDEECRYVKPPTNIPDEADPDAFEGRAYARLPLGSHLIGAGFAVAFPAAKTLRRKEDAVLVADWIALLKRFEQKAKIDPESLFLVATYEHAELALRLAANIDFAGVVIEAPREMLFADEAAAREEELRKKAKKGETAPETGPTRFGYFDSMSQARFYTAFTKAIKEPLLVVLGKNAPDYEQVQKTLLASLVVSETPFSAVLLEGWARTQMTPEEAARERRQSVGPEDEPELDVTETARAPSRRFHYDEGRFETWVSRMEHFLVEHAKTEPRYLPLPDPNARRRAGVDEIFKQLERAAPNLDEEGGDAGGDGGDGGE